MSCVRIGSIFHCENGVIKARTAVKFLGDDLDRTAKESRYCLIDIPVNSVCQFKRRRASFTVSINQCNHSPIICFHYGADINQYYVRRVKIRYGKNSFFTSVEINIPIESITQ